MLGQEEGPYHKCSYGKKSRCGTRKLTDFKRGNKCICPTNNPLWKETKETYKQKRTYLTR